MITNPCEIVIFSCDWPVWQIKHELLYKIAVTICSSKFISWELNVLFIYWRDRQNNFGACTHPEVYSVIWADWGLCSVPWKVRLNDAHNYTTTNTFNCGCHRGRQSTTCHSWHTDQHGGSRGSGGEVPVFWLMVHLRPDCPCWHSYWCETV